MDETDHGLTPRIHGFGSEQGNQSNQRSTHTTPAPVLGLRTASYCTENEWTPDRAMGRKVVRAQHPKRHVLVKLLGNLARAEDAGGVTVNQDLDHHGRMKRLVA